MPQSLLKYSLISSVILHLSFLSLIFWNFDREDENQNIAIRPFEGSSIRIFSRLRPMGSGNPKTRSNPENQNQIGADHIQREIEKFRKNLIYPPSALERGMESDCEWLVKLAENGKVEKVEIIRDCRYKIFDTYFRSALKSWEFSLPPGTEIAIPVRFRIENENDKK